VNKTPIKAPAAAPARILKTIFPRDMIVDFILLQSKLCLRQFEEMEESKTLTGEGA
jgi:hypothetical protein